jgi:hypothetical protein
MENKTHYRKVFKSDHLGVADLEDLIEEKKRLVFTIKEVKQEFGVSVAGRKGDHNIAYFKESIKPLVLNATNSKVMKSFNNGSPFVEDWSNTVVELYIDPNVKMKGDIVGGVRIKPNQPSLKKPQLTPEMPEWSKAVTYMKGEGTIEGIKKRYSLTAENEKKLKDA